MSRPAQQGEGEPLYRRVAAQLADDITHGERVPGERLPSERSLCERFSVSRVTLRQALSLLARQGMVSSRAGSGWYVTELSEPPGALLSFTELAASRGLRASSRTLRAQVRAATLDEAEELETTAGAQLFDLERLRLVEGLAIALDHSRLPSALFPGIEATDFSSESLHATLIGRYGVVPSRADYQVEAAAADEAQARLLDIARGAPVLVTSQTNFDQHGRRIELNEMTYRSDRYRMRAVLVAPAAGTRAPDEGVPTPELVGTSDPAAAVRARVPTLERRT